MFHSICSWWRASVAHTLRINLNVVHKPIVRSFAVITNANFYFCYFISFLRRIKIADVCICMRIKLETLSILFFHSLFSTAKKITALALIVLYVRWPQCESSYGCTLRSFFSPSRSLSLSRFLCYKIPNKRKAIWLTLVIPFKRSKNKALPMIVCKQGERA